MKIGTEEKCETCYFYKKQKIGRDTLLFCKRYPPSVGAFPAGPPMPSIVGGKPLISWEQWKLGLVMDKDDWCGEWKKKLEVV